MSKTLSFYRDGIRELRAEGFAGYTADNGYKLSGNLSSGQKAAISRALNGLAEYDSRLEKQQARERESEETDDGETDTPWYDNAIEDGAWDDIDWFDYDYADDFTDEEADSYDEGDAK